MDWLLLTFFSVVSRSIYGVCTKVLSNKVEASVYTQATLLSLTSACIALLLSPILGGLSFNFSGVSLVAILFVTVPQGLGNIVYFQAIKSLTNSTAQIAFSSILIFNTFLGLIFLNLHLSPINVLGIVLLMLAILSVTSGKIELNRKGVSLMVLSAFLFSAFQLASAKLSKEMGVSTYLLISLMGAAIVAFALKSKEVIKDLRTTQLSSTIGFPLIAAIPSLAYFTFAYYAYRNAPQPGKVAILLTSQVVLTVILSYFILKERDHFLRKTVAALLVLAAAVLIKQT